MGTKREVEPGVWELAVMAGKGADGRYRRRTKRVKASGPRAAQKLLVTFEAEIQAKRPSRGSVGHLLDRWVDHLRVRGRSPSTVVRAEEIVRIHLKPALGDIDLGALSPRDLEKLYATKAAEVDEQGRPKLAPRTIKHLHVVLGTALQQAMRWELVDRNVARLVDPPEVPQHEIRPPTPAQVGRLLEVACELGPAWSLYVRLSAMTGARRGEMCGLRWSAIDRDTGLVTIRTSLSGIDLVERPTKTRSVREVKVDGDTLELVRAEHARQAAEAARLRLPWLPDAHVFADVPGEHAWHPDTATSRWIATCRRAGIAGVRLHDLRHWAATTMLAAGVPLPAVAARLGHRDGHTTIAVYAHRTAMADQGAAEVLRTALDAD